jgi:phospholipase/carboxylesterase
MMEAFMADLIEHHILQDVPKPERVIILLHGIGQNSSYMEQPGKLFAEQMPNTLIVMPEAPIKMHYSPDKVARVREKYDPGFDSDKARSWFNTETKGWPRMMLQLVFNNMPVIKKVNDLADFYRGKYGLQDKDVAFFGMSQGGAIALHSAISREKPVAAVVSHSGMFFGFTRAKSKPDVMMITGEADDYLCDNKSSLKSFFVAPKNSLRRLARRHIPVTDLWLKDLRHEMTPQSLDHAAAFLKKAFNVSAGAGKPEDKVFTSPAPAPATSSVGLTV